MKKRVLVSTAAVLAMLLVESSPTSGQDGRTGGTPAAAGAVPRRPDGKPDFTGRWNGSAGQIAHTNIIEEHTGGFGINAGKSPIDPRFGPSKES